MTNWNGTILGPPHVSRQDLLGGGLKWQRGALGIREPNSRGIEPRATERPREPHLLGQDALRPELPR